MEDVLWHSATSRFSKSIFVKIPRLPTIRVIGSQFISTSFLDLLGVLVIGSVVVLISCLLLDFLIRSGVIACGQFGASMPPAGLLVERGLRNGPQRGNCAPINTRSA